MHFDIEYSPRKLTLILVSIALSFFFSIFFIPSHLTSGLRQFQQQRVAEMQNLKALSTELSTQLTNPNLSAANRHELTQQILSISEKQMEVTKQNELSEQKIIEIQGGARSSIIQFFGTLLLLGTAFVGWRNLKAVEKNAETASENLKIMRQGQITDRFSKAVSQLGESASDKLAVRLGAIYALEGIAKESEVYHPPIMELLCTYVRENSPWIDGAKPQERPPADIQAILTVIGRRNLQHDDKTERRPINLAGADLRGAQLSNAHLEKSFLAGAHLEEANLIGAHLQNAWCNTMHLEGAALNSAHFENANLPHVHFDGPDYTRSADVHFVRFDGANLFCAKFENVFFHETHLEGANLSHATGITFDQLNDKAIWDDKTKFPKSINECIPPPKPQMDYMTEIDRMITDLKSGKM